MLVLERIKGVSIVEKIRSNHSRVDADQNSSFPEDEMAISIDS